MFISLNHHWCPYFKIRCPLAFPYRSILHYSSTNIILLLFVLATFTIPPFRCTGMRVVDKCQSAAHSPRRSYALFCPARRPCRLSYSQAWSPTPSTITVAPGCTAKRSPTCPRMYISPDVAVKERIVNNDVIVFRQQTSAFMRDNDNFSPGRKPCP